MLKIYCAGDNNVDIYLKQKRVYPGGCALNVAAYTAMLGHQVAYVSSVGNDRLGELQLESLKAYGVDVSGVHVIDEQTAWCYIILNGNDRVFGNYYRGAKKKLPLSVEDVQKGQDGNYDLLYTSTDAVFGPGAFEQFGKSSVPAFCDFSSGWTRESLKEGCAIFSYIAISCPDMEKEDVKDILKECVDHGAKMAIGTMGMDGSYVYNGRRFYYQEAFPVAAIDTLGAGDSFLSMYISNYLDGLKQLNDMTATLINQKDISNYFNICEDALISKSMSFAALFASKTCQNHGAFGHDIPFSYYMVSRSDCNYTSEIRT